MPRNTFLPTPASSTDIKGQDGSKMASLQLAFELPPPAVTSEAGANHPNTSATFYPTQASETVKSRRRSSAANPPKDQFALPPPPTRSRKIIQMKPREEPTPETPASTSKTASKGNAGTSSTTQVAGSKRKQPSATSAAGRKIARKTAHSLIERRRRSKMNEEFAVLKGLIPACTGEMHKLAILQASIEYVRYLEDCVTKLKAQCGSEAMLDPEPRLSQSGLPSPSMGDTYNHGHGHNYAGGAVDPCSPDVEMTSSSSAPSPSFTPIAGRSQAPSISPALRPQDPSRHNSYSSVSSDYRLHGGSGGYSTSTTTSPFFGPQHGTATGVSSSHSAFGSALTSPALPPQRDLDQEATTALLMLNQMDRRTSTSTATAPRGMSVRDLLSS
ncbi:hypothetical protein CHGG_00821 [Chaetomium globosum CBS 148.51]|uniref:BHLH domain-containing protein n=1 Tax=Chaetomium globosum (strain ATCC 6205 / CBS 148.51 / DSM 1962 / NBRC 6347 / NRRL 1970) TaxID=306901 RepID=Q2HG33_CHAGB|nr:uncharacterized protein CHGG_00821 [Chaetomium globosum CBS 148.51]EAQ92586.1 hypothetical protein CHGG_00821 [Chaetomium globosum CBS 148.51]